MPRHTYRKILGVVAVIGLSACAAAVQPMPTDEVPPFELRPTAWRLMIENTPTVAKRTSEERPARLEKALAAFYTVVSDRREERDAAQKRKRRKNCNRGWAQLSREINRNRELKGELTIARAWLSIECGFSRKTIPALRRYTKRRKTADFLFYAGHFWYAEALLAMDRPQPAMKQYRWVLGELESPFYPLAMLRTAHCHWDDGEVDEARDYLNHVNDWLGDKSSPTWVRSLKRQVADDLEAFEEE